MDTLSPPDGARRPGGGEPAPHLLRAAGQVPLSGVVPPGFAAAAPSAVDPAFPSAVAPASAAALTAAWSNSRAASADSRLLPPRSAVQWKRRTWLPSRVETPT